jgi:RimK family alpha-L-glutamate ligase
MRFAVLAAPESWYARDLTRAAGTNHQITILPFSSVSASITPTSDLRPLTSDLNRLSSTISAAGTNLADFDAVIVRTMPPGSLEQVVFRMDCLARLEASGVVVLNPAKAVETAVDKFLTTAKLEAAGLKTPRTICCQTPDDAMAAFEQLGGDVVLKPLFGSEGRGITRINDEALALRAFKMLAQFGAVLYLQEFIDHEGYDIRLLMIGEKALAMRRRNKLDWRTNISRGASAESFSPDAKLIDMAQRAAAAIGAPLAGVDILPRKDGSLYVIEVNAVPGWKGLAKATGADVARQVLEFVAGQVASAKKRDSP